MFVQQRGPVASQPLAPRRHRPDYWLLILSAMLLAMGLIVLYSISPGLAVGKDVSSSYFITRQLINIGLGIVIFIVTASIPLKYWKHAYIPLLVIAGAATLMALLLPVSAQYP